MPARESGNQGETMPGLILAHYQELALKGRNRSYFERSLAGNMGHLLGAIPGARVIPIPGRLLVRLPEAAGVEEATRRLRTAFGLSSLAPACEVVEPTMKLLTEAATGLSQQAQFESFRVRARRGNTSFPHSSEEINITVGQALKDRTGARVDLSNAGWTCYIELVGNRAYLYSRKLDAPGGLPVGTSGRVLALLSGGIDSPVAAWRMAKRGAQVDFVHFHGQPFADRSSERQATRLADHLSPWTLRSKLWMIAFGDIQAQIVTSVAQELRIVMYRRFMMRIAESLATREGAQALVTGDCLGQVASQTLPNLQVIEDAIDHLPVFRPLIGQDKLEIERTGRQIGTYDISIQPHQDCCVLFIPRRVTTAASLRDLRQAEAGLDIAGLVDKAVANAQVIDCSFKPDASPAPADPIA